MADPIPAKGTLSKDGTQISDGTKFVDAFSPEGIAVLGTDTGGTSDGRQPTFVPFFDRNTGIQWLLNNLTGDATEISQAAPDAPKDIDPTAAFRTIQEAGAALISNPRLAGTHLLEWQPDENGWRIVRRPPPIPNAPTVLSVDDVDGTNEVIVTMTDRSQFRSTKVTTPVIRKVESVDAIVDLVTGVGTDDVLVTFTDKTTVIRPRAVAPPATDGEVSAQPIEGTDSVLVTGADGRTFVVGAAGPAREAATAIFDDEIGRVKVTQPDGSISFLAPDAIRPTAGDVIKIGDRDLLFNPNTGQLTDVTAQTPGGVQVINGREFLRQPDGSLQPLTPEAVPDIEDLINTRLLAGDAAGAIALADFRDRPTSLEAFNAAMQFAQAPGDVAAISAIARGQTLVSPPPAGQVQRIAEQPEFLIDAFERFKRNISGGAGSPADLVNVVEGFAREAQEQKVAREAAEKEAQRLESQRQVAEAKAREAPRGEVSATGFGTGDTARDVPVGLPTTVESDIGGQTVSTFNPAGVPEEDIETNLALLGLGPQPTAPAPAVSQIPSTREAFEAAGGFTDFQLESIFGPTSEPVAPAPAFTSEQISQFEQEDDFFAGGGVFDDNTAIVGEDGPELAVFPVGTQIVPLKGMGKDKKRIAAFKKAFGIRGMQDGGTVAPLLPFGVRRAISGGLLEPTRRRLLTAAGLPVLSAQAQQNISPDERDVFDRLIRESGISEAEGRRELLSAQPGANRFQGRARIAPQVLR